MCDSSSRSSCSCRSTTAHGRSIQVTANTQSRKWMLMLWTFFQWKITTPLLSTILPKEREKIATRSCFTGLSTKSAYTTSFFVWGIWTTVTINLGHRSQRNHKVLILARFSPKRAILSVTTLANQSHHLKYCSLGSSSLEYPLPRLPVVYNLPRTRSCLAILTLINYFNFFLFNF